ncbi:MAG: class I SAM-dependent methyltransferase [Euzebya sp.]
MRLGRDDPRHKHGAATVLAIDPNPPAFLSEVARQLAPMRQQFNYDSMMGAYTNIDRFLNWVGVVDQIRSVKGGRVLASGCGAGGSLAAYHAMGALEVVGLEVDADLHRLSDLRAQALPGVQAVLYDGQRIPFDDGYFHVVESLDVVEHVADPHAYLAEIARVLAPDGSAFVAIPNRLYPVEQHTGVPLVPWLPLRPTNTAVTAYAHLPWVTGDHYFKVLSVRNVRTCNVSWRSLVALAGSVGLTAHRIHRGDHPECWPFPPDGAAVEWLARRRGGASVSPTRQLVAQLRPA